MFKDEVLEFIHKRFTVDCNWTTGNCYYFALILTHRFTNLEIWYDSINGHFFAGELDDEDNQIVHGFDFSGYKQYLRDDSIVKYSWIEEADGNWALRLYEDCVC